MATERSTGTRTEERGSDRKRLEDRVRELESENERLRTVTGSRRRYRAGVILLSLLAMVAVGGTVVYPESRDVLIGIAGTGAFAAVLLGTLVRGRVLSASVGRAIYDVMWENEVEIASRLGADETARYVPTGEEPPDVRLYLSRSVEDPIPPSESLTATVVRIDERFGLLLEPTGQRFLDLFERTNGGLPDRVAPATPVLREAVVQQFELADYVEVVETDLSEDSGRNRLAVRVRGSVLGDASRLDHPIRSFIAVALARIVNRPVTSEGSTDANGSTTLTFQWNSEPPVRAAEPSDWRTEEDSIERGDEPLEAAE